MTDKQRYRAGKRRVELTAQAIEVALIWDSLPEVWQQYVLEALDGVRRIQQEDATIASRLWTRTDPKSVKRIERKIERYQVADRVKRRS